MSLTIPCSPIPSTKTRNMTVQATDKFYESGLTGLANLKLAFERNRIEIDRSWHILDFGCGVGRIGGRSFAQEFRFYYGVDISKTHLEHAISQFNRNNISNAQFITLQNAIEQNIEFVICFSMIVLQHNPPPVMLYLLNYFLSKLRVGGFAYFQLPCHIHEYSFEVDRYLVGEGKRDMMEMHALPQNYVFEALYQNGLQPHKVLALSCDWPDWYLISFLCT